MEEKFSHDTAQNPLAQFKEICTVYIVLFVNTFNLSEVYILMTF